jgi:dipeptidyl aminopeptidase/acylaminoacyl peptidase
VKLAARIKQPLLLAHGGLDSRVPIEQANAMRSALQANHAALTWLFYADEGHGFYIQKDRADFYRREADFLAANIGPSAPALAAVPAGASTSAV